MFVKKGGGSYLAPRAPPRSWLATSSLGSVCGAPCQGGAACAPPFVFALNFSVGFGNVVCYWCPRDPAATLDSVTAGKNAKVDGLFRRYVKAEGAAGTKFRNGCLKFLPRVVQGNWVLRKTAGSKPALIGNKIHTEVYHGGAGLDGSGSDGGGEQVAPPVPRFVEVNVDVNSDSVARGISSIFRSYVRQVTIDMILILQADAAEDLPEQVLCGARIHKLEFDRYGPLPS